MNNLWASFAHVDAPVAVCGAAPPSFLGRPAAAGGQLLLSLSLSLSLVSPSDLLLPDDDREERCRRRRRRRTALATAARSVSAGFGGRNIFVGRCSLQ